MDLVTVFRHVSRPLTGMSGIVYDRDFEVRVHSELTRSRSPWPERPAFGSGM